jgi:hypothetical protein
MFRMFAAAPILLCLSSLAWVQAQPVPTAVPPQGAPPTKPVQKKPLAKAIAKQLVAAENGPCRLGVISAIGDRFSVEKFGLTVFETEESYVPIENWGLDDLVLARVHAATGDDPAIRKIAYPKGAFEPYFNPKSRLLPDPSQGLPAIVRSFTATTNCERYLVVIRVRTEDPGIHRTLDGIGAYNSGLGSLLRTSHLFASFAIDVLDGRTYENLNRPFAGAGARFSQSMRIMEDPLNKLDNSQFPEPAAVAAGSETLRERTRALVAARLDQLLPDYLGEH